MHPSGSRYWCQSISFLATKSRHLSSSLSALTLNSGAWSSRAPWIVHQLPGVFRVSALRVKLQILTDFLLFFVILRLFHEGHAEPQMVLGYRGVQLQCLSIFRLFFFQGLGVGASRRKYCATRSS